MVLKIGLPSKGRLHDDCLGWLAGAGLDISRAGSARGYAARAEGIDGVEPVLLSAGEIPRELAAGRVHLGITGLDMVEEKLLPGEASLVARLGFGYATLVLAVPGAWADVTTLDDFDEVCGQFRARHGARLRIATKYHTLTRRFLSDFGVADYQLVDSQGATEGTVKNETSEAVADITSTGSTLRANHLRILEDGVILRSEACLFQSSAAEVTPTAQRALNLLKAGISS
ncbi:MAG: ATP phosphoribosyltransferase [Pseudomonadota bacterium]